MKRTNPIDRTSTIYKDLTENMSPRLRLAWDLAEETGLRVSDLINLKAAHVHEGGIVVKEKKTGKTRWVYPSKDMVRRLKRSAEIHHSDWCFPSPCNTKNHIHRDTLTKELLTIREKLQLSEDIVISMHSARKNYARDLLEKTNGDLQAVQNAMRHDKLETTLLYLYGAPVVR